MKQDALFNMIEQQIRPWDVHNSAILDLLREMPREKFLPESHRAFAYMDTELPLVINGVDTGTRLLAPRILARLAQALDVKKNEHVGLVGLGDGYLTALLARFAKDVTAYERNETIMQFAQRNLNEHAVRNVNYELGDGLKSSVDKFDVFVLAGSVSVLSDSIKQKVKIGGRLFAIVGAPDAATMQALLLTRTGNVVWDTEVLFETVASALTQATTHSTFVF